MKILKFKTNVQSQAMLDKLADILNKEELISKWKLDLQSADKILSVSGEEITPDVITKSVKQAGFEAEMIRIHAIDGQDL